MEQNQRNKLGQFIKGIIPHNKGLKTWVCNNCGKEFKAVCNNRAKFRYCSQACKGKKSISLFKKGLVPWNKNKLNIKIRGKNHYNWKGGITERRELNNVEWNILKHRCYERDGWRCLICGKHIHKKGEIQAHHLVPKRIGGPDELFNLTTLCQSDHIKVERKMWARFARKEITCSVG
jgi:uncharacterized protein YjhX (UPF0386 family)